MTTKAVKKKSGKNCLLYYFTLIVDETLKFIINKF